MLWSGLTKFFQVDRVLAILAIVISAAASWFSWSNSKVAMQQGYWAMQLNSCKSLIGEILEFEVDLQELRSMPGLIGEDVPRDIEMNYKLDPSLKPLTREEYTKLLEKQYDVVREKSRKVQRLVLTERFSFPLGTQQTLEKISDAVFDLVVEPDGTKDFDSNGLERLRNDIVTQCQSTRALVEATQ